MKMIGRWVESKAALFDAIAESPLYIYSDSLVALEWAPIEYDDRQYYVDPSYPERVYFKESGVYTLDYSTSAQLEYSQKEDNVKVGAYINGILDASTVSYSFIRNSTAGLSSNTKSVRITVYTPNSFLDLRVQRNEYRGSIYLIEGESTIGLKKERPLNEGGK